MVEAAFVLPILMLFILGVIDLAMWDMQTSATSSAARDGARQAILGATNADCGVAGYDSSVNTYPCSTVNTAIHDAINKRLGRSTFTFKVRCMGETDTTTKVCNIGPSTVDRDRVEVEVTWQRPAMTFVSKWLGASSTVHAVSRMTATA